jgi:hypothetical protein
MNAFALLWIKQAMFFLLEVAVGKLICVSNEYFALYKTMLFVEYIGCQMASQQFPAKL